MVAFAGNSLLARIALKLTQTEATTFTVVRLLSGAVTLWALVRLRSSARPMGGTFPGALVLFTYAITFSFAYVGLSAATGALILFGAAQSTMIGHGVWKGERMGPGPLAGLAIALAGLVVLLLPGATAPDALPALLMLVAGVAWGAYCLLGASAVDPLGVTAGNFVRCAPLALAAAVVMLPRLRIDAGGLACAVFSGAIGSGICYAVWYTVVARISTISASVMQLTIPPIAAVAGALLLGEMITGRLLLASAAVLGGVAAVVLRQARRR